MLQGLRLMWLFEDDRKALAVEQFLVLKDVKEPEFREITEMEGKSKGKQSFFHRIFTLGNLSRNKIPRPNVKETNSRDKVK